MMSSRLQMSAECSNHCVRRAVIPDTPEYPNLGHVIGPASYAQSGFLLWFLAQKCNHRGLARHGDSTARFCDRSTKNSSHSPELSSGAKAPFTSAARQTLSPAMVHLESIANRSVAATNPRLFGGSKALWPLSAVTRSSASGQARWSAQALSMGQTTS